jgi:hypothetical protein
MVAAARIDLGRPMSEIRATLSRYPALFNAAGVRKLADTDS